MNYTLIDFAELLEQERLFNFFMTCLFCGLVEGTWLKAQLGGGLISIARWDGGAVAIVHPAVPLLSSTGFCTVCNSHRFF
jgi:hypothetical protein